VQFLPELELEDIGSDSTKAFGFADELDIGQNKQQPKAPSDPSERVRIGELYNVDCKCSEAEFYYFVASFEAFR
jgi:hypothetical protein